MLSSLSIHNYALISHLEIDFNPGFSVLTGETGAGKSIILGALSLILGQRADVKTIKQNEEKCIVEGIFEISQYSLQSFFEEKGLEFDDKCCILRRELFVSGKSRAFINDSPVGLGDLKELGSLLIDIHSQHQNLDLTDGRFQMQVLDALAGNKDIKERYSSDFKAYQLLRNKIQQLKEKAEKDAEEHDYIKFQFQQLNEAQLLPDEQDELKAEAETLLHVEEIKSSLFQIEQFLAKDEKGILPMLKETLSAASSLRKIYSDANGFTERLETAYIDIKDLAREISGRQEQVEYNPERSQIVNDRLDLLYSLQQKHRVDSTTALIDLRNNLQSKLSLIENTDEELDNLQKGLETVFNKLISSADKLSRSREKAAALLSEKLTEKVSLLGMPYMKFTCELNRKTNPDVTGFDQVQFLFSANKNSPLKPVTDIASGGEISRLMLGVKTLIAGAMALPSIVFDEIDTGVSGEIADRMAGIMQELGKIMQVLTITHLPQIAAKGETHYFVYKKDDVNNATETLIRKLSREERIREIAQMVSGEKLTEAALENAKNLLRL